MAEAPVSRPRGRQVEDDEQPTLTVVRTKRKIKIKDKEPWNPFVTDSDEETDDESLDNPFEDNPFEEDDPFRDLFLVSIRGKEANERDKLEFSSSAGKDNRVSIIQELWDTERKYVQDLEIIVNNYLIPLRDSMKRRILNPTDIPKIFSNVEQILSVNSEISVQLDIVLENGIDPDIEKSIIPVADVFIKNAKLLKVYAEYCANNENAIEVLSQMSKIPEYVAFESNISQTTGKIKLNGFIIKPVQRLCKYPLFFKELIKSTNSPGKCLQQLNKALESLTEVAAYINNFKKQRDNKGKLLELDKVLHGLKSKLSSPGRMFCKEGVLLKRKSITKKKPRAHKIYLFNDMLILAVEKANNVFVKETIGTHLLIARKLDGVDVPFGIEIMNLDTKKRISLFGKNEPERKAWFEELSKVIDAQTSKQDPTQKLAKQMIMAEWKQ